jgi:hypothetical protein
MMKVNRKLATEQHQHETINEGIFSPLKLMQTEQTNKITNEQKDEASDTFQSFSW